MTDHEWAAKLAKSQIACDRPPGTHNLAQCYLDAMDRNAELVRECVEWKYISDMQADRITGLIKERGSPRK